MPAAKAGDKSLLDFTIAAERLERRRDLGRTAGAGGRRISRLAPGQLRRHAGATARGILRADRRRGCNARALTCNPTMSSATFRKNLNRAVAKVAKANTNQEASDNLQRSITELLAVINQVARGELALRGKVTNDALGNVTDSINYMLDNFTKVLERVSQSGHGSYCLPPNNILVAADEMQGWRDATRSGNH